VRWEPLGGRFWLVSLAALVAVVVTVALGFWQLSRAAEKLALQDKMDSRQREAVLDGTSLVQASAATDQLYRRTIVRGTWLASHTVFLDNRQMNGKPGFFAVTPLQLEGSTRVVLVQRGWVPRNFVDRARVPDLPVPEGVVELEGRIAPPPSKLYDFDASQAGVIRQNLDMAQFSREIRRPLLDVSVLQSGPPGDGLLRDWPRVNVGVEKHHGYAFQWFALGGLITLLYGWFQIVRRFFPPR
jgi:surfeit locus 1 family protein